MNTSNMKDQNVTWNRSISKTEEVPLKLGTESISSSDNSTASLDDNHDIIEFGPLKVRQRKKPALTLATGRRSKYETLSPEQEQKRNIRRERNRAAAERVRLSRLNIEQQLQNQIGVLKTEEEKLLNNLHVLQYQKLNLETRIITHEKMCSNRTPINPPTIDLISAFNTTNPPVFQHVEQISDLNLNDLFLDSPSPLQNNYSNSLATIIPDDIDDIDDFMMNP